MIIIISIYDSKCTDFNNNGLVVLSDCISCIVTEELNGMYEATIEYPIDDRGKWRYLLEGNIAKIDGQLYRAYHKAKTLTTSTATFRHITYDLLDNFLENITLTNMAGYGALDYVLTHTQYTHLFTSMGDVGGSKTATFTSINPVEAIMGKDGIINTWGGELVRDNFNIKLLGARGLDRGVLVAYGKNIQGIEETLDMDGLATRLYPTGATVNNIVLTLPQKYIDSQYINNFPHPKIKAVSFSNDKDVATLQADASTYFANTKCDIPQFNYKIDFLELSKTEEYKNYAILETVYMGDTVTIKHSKLNINLKAKVIKIIKNIITNRIEKIELGSFKPNLATSINNSIQDVKNDIIQVTSDYQNAINNATNLITGANGGNVIIRLNDNKKPYEILIMDTIDVMTAVKVWRWNIGGFGYSSTGINGPYKTAITMDGSIVADFINVGVLSANLIKTGIITSKNGKFTINIDGDSATFGSIPGHQLIINADGSLVTPEITVSKLTSSNGTDTLYISAGLMYFNSILYGMSTDGTKAVAMFPQAGLIKATGVQAWGDNGSYTAPAGTLALGKVDLLTANQVTAGSGSSGGIISMGYLTVLGSKNSLQKTENYGGRLINAYETAEYYFGDIGSGIIGEDGECFISIDEIFQECVNVNLPYHVFAQTYNGSIISVNRQVGYFIVKGVVGTEFSWELKAKRLGYELKRMEVQDIPQENKNIITDDELGHN